MISRDIHKARYFTSIITISRGKVRSVTAPTISSCPLASTLYKSLKTPESPSKMDLRSAIKGIIEDKIDRFGFFTKKRKLTDDGVAIPYGASEIMAHGLKNKVIDSAVMVCDGAGTVVVTNPKTAQGIGARMHSILETSPIPAVIKKLHLRGCKVVFKDGKIGQSTGIEYAAENGYRKIAVTINAYKGESLKKIRALESQHKISVIIFIVCTTGIKKERVKEIEQYADIAWACHSRDIRSRLNKKALKVLSGVSPVYVLTRKAMKLISGYSPNIYRMRKEIAGRR